MSVWKHWKKYSFLVLLLVVFLLLDFLISQVFTPYLIESGRFVLNDYELTRRDHPEEVWDKVFFGNSVVISAYREDVSKSDFVNLGLDYGVVEDLWEMVDQGIIQIGSELVVGLSDLTLYDHFETNPTYPWHRAFYEPYCYFQRDRLRLFLEEQLVGVLTGNLSEPAYGDRQKIHYTGSLSQQELEEKVATSKYTNLPLEDFQENMNALEKLADYCDRHGVRMRAVWMPLNPSLEVSESTRAVYEQAKTTCEEQGVEFLDMESALEAACFYDIGHLNYEYGAYRFTEVIDPWLLS